MQLPQCLVALTFLTTTLALPNAVPLLRRRPSPSLYPLKFEARQNCAETCGTVCYFQKTINAAVAEGCQLYQSGQTEGSNSYPHAFDDREGFDLTVPGPWLEFPILNSFKAYNGGSPGADRVVFNTNCELAAVVTHTGASVHNGFVQCDG